MLPTWESRMSHKNEAVFVARLFPQNKTVLYVLVRRLVVANRPEKGL